MSNYKSLAMYYIFYGLKGLSIYLLMFCIMNLSPKINFFDFGISYSLFLILVPLLNFGVSSLILRYSYSYKNQQMGFMFSSMIQFIAIVVALLTLLIDIEIGLVILWAIFRSLYLSYESFLISGRHYLILSSLYLFYIIGLLLVSLGVYNETLINLSNVLISLIFLELIVLPFFLKHLSKESLNGIYYSSKVRSRILTYVVPISVLSVLMASFLNFDKLIISSLTSLKNQDEYVFLFFVILAIHRFLTTPFIMRYSPQYYEADDNKISSRIVLGGMVSIIICTSLFATFFKFVQPQNFLPTYIFAFSYLVLALFLLNLQMLYFKKRLLLNILIRNFFMGFVLSFFVMILTLTIFGTQFIDVALVTNSIVMVYFLAQSNKVVENYFIHFLAFLAIVFLLIRL